MRIDATPAPVAALLAVVLLAGAATLHAQRDTVILDPAAVGQTEPTEVRVVAATLRLRGDHTVEANEVVDGGVVVHRGDLNVHGRVNGDVTVVGGSLVLHRGARVEGSAHVRGGSLRNEGAVVLGEMSATTARRAAEPRARARTGPAAAVRADRWLTSMGRGLLGIVQTIALGLILAGIGAGVVFYGLSHLNEVSDVVRRDRWRAVWIGVFAQLLAGPLFLLGLLTLVVTLVGIPLLLVYVPLYWVGLALAAGFGIVAVAHAIGERTMEQRGGYDSRYRNAYAYVFLGLGLLLAPLVAAHLVGIVGYLGFIGTLILFFANLLLWGAATLGLGAVLMVGYRRWSERRQRRWRERAAATAAGADGFDDPFEDRDGRYAGTSAAGDTAPPEEGPRG